MAAPFVYVPEASSSSTPVTASYPNPYYSAPYAGLTPFLPPSPVLYPSSPYLAPSNGTETIPDTPEAFNKNSLPWPEDIPPYESPYIGPWTPLSPRKRTKSWQGSASALGSPFLQPKAPAFLHTQSGYSTSTHKRNSRSLGEESVPARPSWVIDANPYLNSSALLSPHPPLQIHPWLNGDAPSPIFSFDLASSIFAPKRLAFAHPPKYAAVASIELTEPAFYPPRTTLRILHPRLPFWPIDLALPEDVPAPYAPPIALGDVLVALYRALHIRIASTDWETLSSSDAQLAARAFTQRCRAEAVRSGAAPALLHDGEVAERSEGVKRVDFLLGKTNFKGFVRFPGDPEGCVRLVVA
ncbi:hypothetical protein C8R43DRAFT_997339 [Mycena crocata]|nr:hypothetical protein C8R43DRAFT_997339 [Mycena crocata]